jgi:ketosteroid isomerase-like protein
VSEQNIELHRRFVEAFNARDLESLIALADPKIEYHSVFAEVGAIYHGHEEVRRWHRDLEETWGQRIHIEPDAFFDLGEYTLLFAVVHGRGQQSGAEVAMPYAGMARWRDGLCIHAKVYPHREDALKDLDISEEALEEIAP